MKYSEKYYSRYRHQNPIRSFFSRQIKFYPKHLFRLLQKSFPKKILDVGCGTGNLLLKIRDADFGEEYYGVDIGYAENPPNFIHFTRCDAGTLPFAKESFDLIIMRHLLEHLHEPTVALLEAKRVLKQGGYIYLEVPSVKNLFNPFGGNFYDDPTHVRPYTKRALSRMFDDSGFEDIQTGVKRNIFIIAGGLPYILIGKLMKDPLAVNIFAVNLFGLDISVTGRKTDHSTNDASHNK